jgi:hypothetical protein
MAKGRKVPPPKPTVMAGVFNLEEMWEAAGRPADRHPIDFVQSPQGAR